MVAWLASGTGDCRLSESKFTYPAVAVKVMIGEPDDVGVKFQTLSDQVVPAAAVND